MLYVILTRLLASVMLCPSLRIERGEDWAFGSWGGELKYDKYFR